MKYIAAAIQMSAKINDRAFNVSKARTLISDAAKQGADICVLPELALYEFFPQWKDDKYYSYADDKDGELIMQFCQLAKEKNICIVLPFFEKALTGVYYNSVALIDNNGAVAGIYHKNHIPFTKSYEKYYFTPGDGFPVFDLPLGRVGVCICYDRRYPETCRELVKKGAEVIYIPISSSIIDGFSEQPMWECELRTRALENQCWIVACNRTGKEQNFDFFGWSLIVSPRGEVVKRADETEDMTILAEIDTDLVKTVRCSSPLLRDRRPDIYTK